MPKFSLFIGLFLIFSSCKNMSNMDAMKFENPEMKYAIPATLGKFKEPTRPFRIINAYIDANLLFLEIEYRASCSTNDQFEFISGDLFYDEEERESREARLFIKGNGEKCSLTSVTKIIDIRPLIGQESRDAKVLLYIGGWRTDMEYAFVPG